MNFLTLVVLQYLDWLSLWTESSADYQSLFCVNSTTVQRDLTDLGVRPLAQRGHTPNLSCKGNSTYLATLKTRLSPHYVNKKAGGITFSFLFYGLSSIRLDPQITRKQLQEMKTAGVFTSTSACTRAGIFMQRLTGIQRKLAVRQRWTMLEELALWPVTPLLYLSRRERREQW